MNQLFCHHQITPFFDQYQNQIIIYLLFYFFVCVYGSLQAFQQGSHLATDVSNAILKLSETGELQRIHNKWLLRSACSSQGGELSVDRLELKSFKGLFFIIGFACVLSLLVYLVPTIYQYTKRKPDSSISSGPRHMQMFISSIDEKEDSVIVQEKDQRHNFTWEQQRDASLNAY